MGYCGLPEEGRRGENFRSGMVHGRQYIVAFGNGGIDKGLEVYAAVDAPKEVWLKLISETPTSWPMCSWKRLEFWSKLN